MFEAVAVGIIMILKLFPDTPTARLLHTYLVERPAAWIASRTRAHVIMGLILIGLAFSGAEFVMLAGTADVAMLMAWDMAVFFDALIVSWAAASTARVGAAKQYLLSLWRGGRPRVKARRRAVRQRRARQPSNDDEPAPGLLAA
jgi:hypothetical protein